jgi:hypothetical protein
MRSHGFHVPDPTEGPDGEWSVIVNDPKASGLDPADPGFREAMFLTCGPLGGPLTGVMVIGGPRAKVDQFISCMKGQGFDLPDPVKDTSGDYDIDEWQFDLSGTGIDTSTSEWNGAVFVTCAPAEI